MRALPASLDAVQARVRRIYADGWRPPVPDGPTRDELAALIAAHTGTAPAGPGPAARLAAPSDLPTPPLSAVGPRAPDGSPGPAATLEARARTCPRRGRSPRATWPAKKHFRSGRTAAVLGSPGVAGAVTVPAVRAPAPMPWAPGP